MKSVRHLFLSVCTFVVLAGCAQVVSGPRSWVEEDIVDHHISLVSDSEIYSFGFEANGSVYGAMGTRTQSRMLVLRWEITPSGSLVLEELNGRVFAEFRIVEIKGDRYVLDDGKSWRIFRRS